MLKFGPWNPDFVLETSYLKFLRSNPQKSKVFTIFQVPVHSKASM
jgi:hypothetical protein